MSGRAARLLGHIGSVTISRNRSESRDLAGRTSERLGHDEKLLSNDRLFEKAVSPLSLGVKQVDNEAEFSIRP
jgi:hypothetical protein